MAKETLPTWPNGWDEDIKKRLEWLTDEQKEEMLKLLIDEKKAKKSKKLWEKKEKLKWKKEKILENLKKNNIKVTKNVESMWYKWKVINIHLPAIGSFKWFTTSFFISDEKVNYLELEKHQNRRKLTKDINYIAKLLKALQDYMKEKWVNMDKGIDFKEDLKTRESYDRKIYEKCKTWDCLKEITGLDDAYWIADWAKKIAFLCENWYCTLSNSYQKSAECKLLLR